MNNKNLDVLTIFNSITAGIKMAFIEIKTHKLRSFLSLLGVLLGCASLVAMLTLIGGINKFLSEKMTKWVGSVWYWTKWDPPEEDKISWSRSPGLKLSDADYLKENSSFVKNAYSKIVRHDFINFGTRRENIVLRGDDSSSLLLEKEDIKISIGRWIDSDEFNSGFKNCVISWELADAISKESRLKKRSQLLGTKLKFRNVQFNIIGVYEPVNQDNKYYELRRGVIISIKAMKLFITGNDPNPGSIQIQIKDPKKLKEQASAVARVLSEKHRGIEDFEYQAAEWANKITKMLNNVSIIMGIISFLSLSVGGLSIMNVMLSSISERIREIGTRKALGADNWQIFTQFITETITLCFIGGVIGSSIGCLPLFFKEAIMKSTQGAIEPTIIPIHVLLIFFIILSVGIIFGLYPALKASAMNPIDALRYE